MKAVCVPQYGDIKVMTLSDIPTPTPSDTQVLVHVEAASINPFDVMLRSGVMQQMIPLTLPYVIGGDFAGTVVALGSQVQGLTIGDKVFGQAVVANGGSGSTAEFVAANADATARAPRSIPLSSAASLPLAGVSALQALEEHISLQKGQKILIHGGAGGIGSLAILLAKHLGAYVATTASSRSHAYVTSLGADLVVDYDKENFATVIHDYDAVFDTVGGDVTTQSLSVLHTGGTLVTMIGQIDTDEAAKSGTTAIRQQTHTTHAILERLAKLVEDGVIIPQIDKTYDLSAARDAYTYFETKHPQGKVVITVAAKD